ncbi:EpsG family protein [Acinetobacter lwoffii]|uniref:EpsG family protein n=1 Tax=Acinetobacter lwoffii TaxID=28090 RepID=UPI0021CDE74B|nr:EpsG family protein [Acinetobacter lwoffii]MCU4614791.1 EpsG family protein [Acinetobacter lwoffii]
MIIYILIIFFVCCYIYLEKKLIGRDALIIPVIFLSIIAALRNYTVGTDTPTYTLPFLKGLNFYSYTINPNIEIGYEYLVKLILLFTNNYSIYFFIISFFIIFLNFLVIKKYAVNYLFSIYLYIALGFYTIIYNPVRQSIAMAIVFMSLPYLLEKKLFKFCLIVYLASLFHISALIFIPIYFLLHLKLRIETKFVILFLGSTFLSKVLLIYLNNSNERYSNYTDIYLDNGDGRITVLFYSLLGFYIYLCGKKMRNNYIYANFEQLLICGLGISIPILFLGTDPSGPLRILNYFTWFFIFLLPYTVMLYSYKSRKFILILMVFFFFLYYLTIVNLFGGIVPYIINPSFEIF